MPGPAPEPASEAARRARRDWVRTHHPDRGGDPDAFADGLARLDAARAPAPRLRVEAVPAPRPRLARLVRLLPWRHP